MSGRVCVCGGWASCVCLYLKLQTSVLPFAFEIPLKLTSAHHLFPCSFFLAKRQNRPLDLLVLCVAGCTTGSLCPWYPNLRDKVLSLYKAQGEDSVLKSTKTHQIH